MDINFSISLKLDKISLNSLDENISIKDVKSKLSENWKEEVQNYNLIYKGQILNDSMALKDVGVLSGSMIYCLPKNDVDPPAAVPLSLIEVQQLLVSLRAAVTRSNFRISIQKLRSPEQIAKLIAECPALCKDPASLAYVQDPDLVKSLQHADHLTKVIETKPVLGRVLQIVCNLITSDIASPDRSRHLTYSLDTMSDEEMDIDPNDDGNRSMQSSDSNSQFITPAQLATALANASGSSSSWSVGLSPSGPRSELTTPSSTPFNTPAPASGSSVAGGASPGGSFITSEMFSQALQNAIALSSRPGGGGGGASGGSTTGQSTERSRMNQPIENIEESLQLMSEMGIPDRDLSLQALQASNGDVQAAVNLIFSQWMADD